MADDHQDGPALVGEVDGRVVPIRPWGLVVGRAEWCTLRLDDPAVSRAHGQVVWEDGKVVLRDAGSTNGTYVNGQRVRQAVLADGDHIRFGNEAYRFRLLASLAGVPVPPDRRAARGLEALRALTAEVNALDDERAAVRAVTDFLVAEARPDRLFVARTRAAPRPEAEASPLPGAGRGGSGGQAPAPTTDPELRLAAIRTRPDLDRRHALAPLARTPLRRVVKSRQTFCPSAATSAGANHEATSISMRAASLGSVLAVPLVARGEVLGALQAERFGDRPPFDETDVLLAELAANVLASAIVQGRGLTPIPEDELAIEPPVGEA